MEENLEDLIKNVDNDKITSFSIAKKLGDLGVHTLEIKSENVLQAPKEYLKNHRLTNLKAFLSYVERYATGNTTIFFDFENSMVHCELNEKELLGGTNNLSCLIDKTHLVNEMKIANQLSNADQFLSFIKARKPRTDNFLELYSLMSSVKISSSIEKTDIKGKRSENSYIVKHAIQGQEKGEPRDFPDKFVFEVHDFAFDFTSCVVYNIICDIYYGVNSDHELRIEVIVSNQKEALEALKKSYYDFLIENAPEGVLVTIGSPSYKGLIRE